MAEKYYFVPRDSLKYVAKYFTLRRFYGPIFRRSFVLFLLTRLTVVLIVRRRGGRDNCRDQKKSADYNDGNGFHFYFDLLL